MMPNFSINIQLKNELNDFFNTRVYLAGNKKPSDLRFLKKDSKGYYYNQWEMINIIDLYWNSQFEDGKKDSLGQTKMFINVGKFRSEVSTKQIAISTKNFKFYPEDFADPYTAIFMNRDWKEWSKENYFAEVINTCEENFPKYGSVVLKEVDGEVDELPLQTLRNDQTAKNLDVARYVIEEHADMSYQEIMSMPDWDTEKFDMKFSETKTVYERYGHVPLDWFKKKKGLPKQEGDEKKTVDCVCIMTLDSLTSEKPEGHIFYLEKVTKRPYSEAHWSRQHGRWLGIGVMEEQIPNQVAKNIVVNLLRRSLHWSSKKAWTTNVQELIGKSLATDFKDGSFIGVGPNGQIQALDMTNRALPEFRMLSDEGDRNSDQKAFTYEVTRGESMPAQTPFRLGVVLSNAANDYFKGKKEKLGLMFEKLVCKHLVPMFIKDMSKEEKIFMLFSGEEGFDFLKDAAMKLVRSEAAKFSLMSGTPVDVSGIIQSVNPFEVLTSLPFTRGKEDYKSYKYKFDFDITGESVDIETKIETYKTYYQLFAQAGDPRAERVLERIGAITGEPVSQFGPKPEPVKSPLQVPDLKTPNAQGSNLL